MNKPQITERQQRVLTFIKQNEGSRYVDIKRGVGKVEVSCELSELRKKGLIERRFRLGRPKYFSVC